MLRACVSRAQQRQRGANASAFKYIQRANARDGQREKLCDTARDLRACVSRAQQRQRGANASAFKYIQRANARDGQREKLCDTARDLRACVSRAQQRQRGGISAVRLRFTRTAETARSEKRALSEIFSARTARDKRCHARDGQREKLCDTARDLRACVSRARLKQRGAKSERFPKFSAREPRAIKGATRAMAREKSFAIPPVTCALAFHTRWLRLKIQSAAVKSSSE